MENMELVRIRNIQTGRSMARIVRNVELRTIPRRFNGEVEIKWYINITFGPIGNFSQLYSCDEWELVQTMPLCKDDIYKPHMEKILQDERWYFDHD